MFAFKPVESGVIEQIQIVVAEFFPEDSFEIILWIVVYVNGSEPAVHPCFLACFYGLIMAKSP